MSNFIKTENRGSVFEVTIDRPPVNAITHGLSRELHEIMCGFRDDPALRVAILTGAGNRAFSAGWDLKEVALATDPAVVNDEIMEAPGGFGGITEMWDLHKPVIAAINGAAVGGGFEIALAADIIVAVESAVFQLPEMQRGFVPDAGAIQRLPRRLPYNVAVEMMLTGRRMSATEAVGWGLVHAAVKADDLMPRARMLAETIAEGAPLAVQALLEIIAVIDRMPEQQAFETTKRQKSGLPFYERMLTSEDFLEGPRAFAEKRKPVWKGA